MPLKRASSDLTLNTSHPLFRPTNFPENASLILFLRRVRGGEPKEDDNKDKDSEHTQEGDPVTRSQIENLSTQPGTCCPSNTPGDRDKTIDLSKVIALKQICRARGEDGCNGPIAQPEKDGVSIEKPTMVRAKIHQAEDAYKGATHSDRKGPVAADLIGEVTEKYLSSRARNACKAKEESPPCSRKTLIHHMSHLMDQDALNGQRDEEVSEEQEPELPRPQAACKGPSSLDLLCYGKLWRAIFNVASVRDRSLFTIRKFPDLRGVPSLEYGIEGDDDANNGGRE